MLSLTADASQVEATYGLNARKSLLFSAIRLDSYPLVAPLIAQTDKGQYLLVRQQEQGNALSAGVPKDQIRFYAPWVTIDPRVVADTPASMSLTSLVQELAGGAAVRLAADVVYSHYRALSGSVELVVADQDPTPVTAYELDLEEVLTRFAAWRETGVRTARRLIENVEHLSGLADEFTADQDSRLGCGRSALPENWDAQAAGARRWRPGRHARVRRRAASDRWNLRRSQLQAVCKRPRCRLSTAG
ncbi:hypothetical protein SANTM175S_06504 [Streptomyces antimycoticus]